MFYDATARKREMPEVFPRRFGKYVLLKSLARGGMGEIYVAATGEPGFQKFCVIKKVIAERADRTKAARFLDEAKVVLRLAHANLVPTFDSGEHDGEFYIAMELVEGKDLREIWNRCVRTRTRIPLDVALHVGRETARALAYVHSYGDLKLVHRDVAPPNILLSYFGEVKLTDFGLARSVLKQEHTAPGVVFGRAAYLAPEQARGEVADARSDIYSLGVVVWELLTGHQYLQLQNLDAATAMSLVRHPNAQPPSAKAAWVTPELDAVIMRALAPAREERYQTAEEMRQALSDVIARLSPRADAERSAEFMRTLCGDVMREEQAERERLLDESIGRQPDAEDISDLLTPVRGHRADGTRPPPESAAPIELNAAPPPAPEAPRGRKTPADFTGRVIEGRYRILRVLGEGGMGTVYAAEHVEIGKGVAVKILHPQYSRQQDLVERFRREARAASRIGHPHIIDVTDFGTTEDGCAYFVMEHLDGIDLADVLAHERRLDPARAVQITIQICRALEAAHAAGVIHRDLKPENIFLVARDGRADFVKVLDFGIARSIGQDSSRLTNPGIAMGTPEYMAPEQAMGGLADRRSDIYSVGALLYEMVTGVPPHGEAEEASPLKKQEPPRPPRELRPDLPEEIELVILRALERDPAKRPQRMAALEYDLVKTQWGRPRAVSDLLGLRGPEARAEESGGTRDRLPVVAAALGTALGFEAAPPGQAAVARTRSSQPALPALAVAPARTSGQAPAVAAPAPAGRALRVGAPLAIAALLAATAVVAFAAWREIPWARTSPLATAPATPAVDARAARIAALNAELETLLTPAPGAALTFAQVPALEDRFERLRREGATAAAGTFAARAARALEQVAARELDGGDIDTGVAHYKIALGLDPGAQGTSQLAATLRGRAETALHAEHAAEAVRWARTAVGLAEADPDAHALLAEALLASHDDAAAAEEFGKALASRPTDSGFKRGLDRARKRATRPAAPRLHAKAASPESARAPDEDKSVQPDPSDPSGERADTPERAPEREKPEPKHGPGATPDSPSRSPTRSASGEAAPEE
jgi:serine/threonine protein kinase/tetratricopeptide (TPR) repeat protein